MKGIILVLFGVLFGNEIYGQSKTIVGSIVDEISNEPLPEATVFINKSSLKSVADEMGVFSLKQLPIGTYELIVHYPGFQLLSRMVNTAIETDLGIMKLTLLKKENSTREKVGSKTATWQNHFKDFKKTFLGDDDIIKQCEILNPYVLNFSKESGILRADAREAIEISNLYFGYKVSYYIDEFESSRNATVTKGYFRFEEISTKGGATALDWMRNRRREYSGSSQHFFNSIVSNQISEQEFFVYTIEGKKTKPKKIPFFDLIGSKIHSFDTLKFNPTPDANGHWQITISDNLEIHHRGTNSNSPQYEDVPYAVSWMNKGTVVVNADGTIIDSGEFLASGQMARDQIVRQLPINFNVEKVVTVKLDRRDISADRVQEKIYVSFDKPYYYLGEMIWMKASINYRYPHLRDSMSRTLYVELINSFREIVKSQILQIDSGFAKGNFVVPDTLTHGIYYLRAYTNLNRNFDGKDIFIKPIPILSITQKVISEEVDFTNYSELISIKADKNTYRTREKITLDIKVKDSEGVPVKSFLSISVTDAQQVVPIEESSTIEEDFRFTEPPPSQIFEELKFPVEYGITFNGQFVDKKGRPEKATVSIMQGDFENLAVLETEADGTFQLGGLQFYDSVNFHFQAKDGKNKPHGRVHSIEHVPMAIGTDMPLCDIPIEETESPQRLISEYEVPQGARLLQEILIKGRREEQKIMRPYGNPDYVIKTDDLNISTNNLMLILQGKVPGLTVRTVSDSTGVHKMVRIVRASGLTILGPTEPLVMIDDAPMSGIAGDILASINAYTVESIEVITRVNPTFGSMGANGVIMIYTRKGISPDYVPPTKPMQVIKLRGYVKPVDFRYPNYGKSGIDRTQIDYRSIIYWNPDLYTNQRGTASVSFYAADLKTTYRIVVEGITENNKPVRGVYYVSVNNND